MLPCRDRQHAFQSFQIPWDSTFSLGYFRILQRSHTNAVRAPIQSGMALRLQELPGSHRVCPWTDVLQHLKSILF